MANIVIDLIIANVKVKSTDLSSWRTNTGAVFNYSGNGVVDFNLNEVVNVVSRNDFYQKNMSKTRQVPTA